MLSMSRGYSRLAVKASSSAPIGRRRRAGIIVALVVLDNGVLARLDHLGSMACCRPCQYVVPSRISWGSEHTGTIFSVRSTSRARARGYRAAARGAGRATGSALVDINAVAAARHCHKVVLVVGLFALIGNPLVDDRLRVGSVATLMIAMIKWQ
jgi:hypothetical protein